MKNLVIFYISDSFMRTFAHIACIFLIVQGRFLPLLAAPTLFIPKTSYMVKGHGHRRAPKIFMPFRLPSYT